MLPNSLKPSKILSIDIGTNSIHCILADIDEKGKIRVYYTDKKSIRLGASIENGLINQKAIETTIEVIDKFKQNSIFYSPMFVRAVATSAVREALNKDEFVEAIKLRTGVEVDVIQSNREGELIYKGVINGLNLQNDNIMVIDIGGGSTELVFGKDSKASVIGMKLGAVRTTLDFFPNYKTSIDSIYLCQKHVRELINTIKNSIPNNEISHVIGTSGTIQAVSRITLINNGFDAPKPLNNITLSINDLELTFDKILTSNTSKTRSKINGLEPSRVDIISAGVIIFREILREFSIPKITLSSYSLREGIVFDAFESRNKIN